MKIKKIYKSTIFLRITFVISVFVIFYISAITYKHVSLLDNSSKSVNHSYEINLELERLFSYLKDAETGQRGFLITKDSIFLKPYLNSQKKIDHSFAIVKGYTINNPDQENNLRKLQFYISKRRNYLSAVLHLSLKKSLSDKELIEKLIIGNQTMDSIRSQINEMILLEKKTLKSKELYNSDRIHFTPFFVYITLLTTLLLITISYIRISKDLNKLKVSNNRLMVLNESNNLAEIVGSFGSWQLNIATNEYTFSDNSYRLLGVEPQAFDAGQENFMKYIHLEDLESFQVVMTKMKKNEHPKPITYRVIREDKLTRYFRTTGKTVTSKLGDQILIVTISDVTDEVLASLSLEQQNLELEANNKELVSFNYAASHDLQEPLRKIQTFVSRLHDKEYEKLSESGKEFMVRIHNSAERMRILIDDLLQYSRTTKKDKIFESVNLNELLENAKSDLFQSIEEKNAIIESEKLPKIKVIPFQIQQLFANIIGNSLKYSKADSVPKIKILCKKVTAADEELIPLKTKNKFYKISFEDNGIGFEQIYAEKIFLLFNRLHNKNDYAGTGIGLAICKKIMENHKGFIFAEGTLNESATFIIYLPEDLN